MWSNFHTHSNYCDGKGSLVDYIASAKNENLQSLGFSSHAPIPFDCKWCMKADDLTNYLNEIEYHRSRQTGLELYKGLEIDFIPEVISPRDFAHSLDYTIGSIHFVDAFADGRHWEIDGTSEKFKEGLYEIFNGDSKSAVIRYCELTREMIAESSPDILGHMDKIKIQNKNNVLFDESERWYQLEIIKILDLAKEAGTIVEINTRGIYQKKSATTYPGPWIIKLIAERDIPVTISSDAHTSDDLVNEFSLAAEELLKAGINKISVLREGIWQQTEFDKNGLNVR